MSSLRDQKGQVEAGDGGERMGNSDEPVDVAAIIREDEKAIFD